MEIPENPRLFLRPRRAGTFGLLVISSLFVAGGAWMASQGNWLGWVTTAFFGLGVIVAMVQLLPNASYLLVTENGFEVRSLYRSWFVSWDEVETFGTVNIGHNNMVAFRYSDRYDRVKATRKIVRAIAGYDGALPETYGFKADELANLLSEYKQQFSGG